MAIPLPKGTKLGPKTIDCVFIGYAEHSSAYRFLVIRSEGSNVSENVILESRYAEFFENIFPKKINYQRRDEVETRNTFSSKRSKQLDTEIEPRRSKRVRTETSFDPDYITFLTEGDPLTYNEAMSSPDAPFWREAIVSEMESIMQN